MTLSFMNNSQAKRGLYYHQCSSLVNTYDVEHRLILGYTATAFAGPMWPKFTTSKMITPLAVGSFTNSSYVIPTSKLLVSNILPVSFSKHFFMPFIHKDFTLTYSRTQHCTVTRKLEVNLIDFLALLAISAHLAECELLHFVYH